MQGNVIAIAYAQGLLPELALASIFLINSDLSSCLDRHCYPNRPTTYDGHRPRAVVPEPARVSEECARSKPRMGLGVDGRRRCG